MKLNRLASVISRGTFLMEERFAISMMPMAARFLNGERVSFFEDDEEQCPGKKTWSVSPDGKLLASNINDSGNPYQGAPVGSIVVIHIEGTIMKDDYCGAPGTDTMSSWIKEAIWSDNVAGIILKVNSGGGTVEGTGEFAQVIKWADGFKPVVAFTDGIMASAAYWIGSSCRRIFASFGTVEIGSIGTAIKFMDNREAMKMYGYREIYINADPSVDKNQDYYKALDGNFIPIKTQVLNPTNDIFILNVRENRAGVLIELELTEDGVKRIEPLSGKMYLAQAAIDNGLIDEISTFDQVCEYTMDLAQNPNPDTTQKSNNMFGNKFSSLSAMAGKAAASITEDMVAAANNQIAAQNIDGVTLVLDSELESISAQANEGGSSSAALTAANDKVTQLTAQVNSLTTAKSKAEGDLASTKTALTNAEESRDEWKAKAVEYGADAADEHTTGKKNGNDNISGTKEVDDENSTYSEADAALAKMKANQVKLPTYK